MTDGNHHIINNTEDFDINKPPRIHNFTYTSSTPKFVKFNEVQNFKSWYQNCNDKNWIAWTASYTRC